MTGVGKKALLMGLVFAACLLAALPANAAANAGDLDPSFGTGGIATVEVHNGFPKDLAIDHQGRIVVGGYRVSPGGAFPVAVRLEPDGSLDKGFGSGGFLGEWCDFHGDIAGVAVDGADRVVLAGTTPPFSVPSGICVVRLLSNGQPDRSFSGDGKFTLETADPVTDIAVDREGRVLLADGDGLTAIRLTDSGALDPTFGEGGIASLHLGQESQAQAIAVDSFDRVVLAGAVRNPGSSAMAGLATATTASPIRPSPAAAMRRSRSPGQPESRWPPTSSLTSSGDWCCPAPTD